MNKRQIVASLNKIANELDNSGFNQEANLLTDVMVKIAQNSFMDNLNKFLGTDGSMWINANLQKMNTALLSKRPMEWLMNNTDLSKQSLVVQKAVKNAISEMQANVQKSAR